MAITGGIWVAAGVYKQDTGYSASGRRLNAIFKNVALSRPVWFAGSPDFIQEFASAYNQDTQLRGFSLNTGRLTNVFNNKVGGVAPRTVLIPPRRSLEEEAGVNFSVTVNSSGSSLINFLFYCQSQPESTSEKNLTEELLASFEDISGGFSYRIVPATNNVIHLYFRSPNGVLAIASQCGQGLQDLLILIFFMISDKYDLLLIEEPESHLHPDMQRKLLAFMSQRAGKQYVIATHSNVFLDSTYVDRVFQTKYDGQIAVEDQTTRAALLSELGYQVTDNLVSDAVILVEGPSDIPVIETFLIKMGAFPKYQIKFWPLGGDIMDKVDLRVFAEGYRLFALIDQDPSSGPIRKRFVAKCEEIGTPVCRLERYALENYMSVRAIREVFGGQVPSSLESLDPKTQVAKQLGFDIKSRTKSIARLMDLDDLAGTDLLKFLETVVESCRKTS